MGGRRSKVSNRKRKKAEKAKRTRPHYADGLKETAVGRMMLGESVVALSEELGVHRSTLYEWKQQSGPGGGGGDESPKDRQIRELVGKVAHLEAVLGRKELERDFFAGALRRVGDLGRTRSGSGGTGSTTKSGSVRKAN